jgi:uncharacterized membrane protein YhaH (DUF805 family)
MERAAKVQGKSKLTEARETGPRSGIGDAQIPCRDHIGCGDDVSFVSNKAKSDDRQASLNTAAPEQRWRRNMNFVDAVKICFVKYADFNGCGSRPEFWWWILFTSIAALVLRSVSFYLSTLFSLATFLPSIAVTARRLHDTDRSGWWQLLYFVPVIGWILLIIWCLEPGEPNRYGGSV